MVTEHSWNSRSRECGGRFGTARAGNLVVSVGEDPLAIRVTDRTGGLVQHLHIEGATGAIGFDRGNAPLLGFGEGGPQFDRRGSTDAMRNGQGAYRLRTHGGRVPIQWLVGTEGWGLFVHQPLGAFDLTGVRGRMTPSSSALPLDVFVVLSHDPRVIMREYARVTGLPEMPPNGPSGISSPIARSPAPTK